MGKGIIIGFDISRINFRDAELRYPIFAKPVVMGSVIFGLESWLKMKIRSAKAWPCFYAAAGSESGLVELHIPQQDDEGRNISTLAEPDDDAFVSNVFSISSEGSLSLKFRDGGFGVSFYTGVPFFHLAVRASLRERELRLSVGISDKNNPRIVIMEGLVDLRMACGEHPVAEINIAYPSFLESELAERLSNIIAIAHPRFLGVGVFPAQIVEEALSVLERYGS